MSVTVMLTLRAKDDSYDQLKQTMSAILPDTAKRDGAEFIGCSADDAAKTCVLYEVWDKIESQQSYMAWRTERGEIDALVGMLREPPQVDVLEHIF
ncbi:MAG: antibiotic biosynthesis monooxygenase [Pseudomonadota bacterium]